MFLVVDLFVCILLDHMFFKESEADKKKTIFQPLVCSPNGRKGQSWARPTGTAQNSTQVSHVHGRAPSAWAICCFPRCMSRESDQKWSSWDLRWHSLILDGSDAS